MQATVLHVAAGSGKRSAGSGTMIPDRGPARRAHDGGFRVRVVGAVGEGRRALGRRKLAARIHRGQGLIGGEGVEQVLRERGARLRRIRLLHPQ